MINVRFVLLFLLLSISSAHAALLSPELDKLRAECSEKLFNMQYDDAVDACRQMTKVDPKHPAGYAYLANTIWQGYLGSIRRIQTGLYNRTDAFFRETEEEVDPKVDREFREAASKAISLAQARLEVNPNDVEALYYMGIAKNISAGYDATVKRSFLSALRNGSKGVDLHRKVIKLDPALVDAQLSIGLFNYVVGSLPWGVKILVFFGGIHGSRKEGIRLLEKVAQDGSYAKDEAAASLILLYNREKRLGDSLKLIKNLSAKYPQNSLLRLETATTLAQLKKFNESYVQFESILKDSASMTYMADLIHYKYGEALMDGNSWQRAYDQFMEAAASPKAPASLITMAYLSAGQCSDVLGKREEAIARYKSVLRRKEALDSHDQAKKYLKRPFES